MNEQLQLIKELEEFEKDYPVQYPPYAIHEEEIKKAKAEEELAIKAELDKCFTNEVEEKKVETKQSNITFSDLRNIPLYSPNSSRRMDIAGSAGDIDTLPISRWSITMEQAVLEVTSILSPYREYVNGMRTATGEFMSHILIEDINRTYNAVFDTGQTSVNMLIMIDGIPEQAVRGEYTYRFRSMNSASVY
jgi:hypothetical protein